METIDEATVDGVTRRRFDLMVEGRTVPGLHWRPAGGTPPRATVLVGHGGFQSKEAPNIVELAAQLARERSYATIALDAPGHGERRTDEQVRQQEETLRRLRAGGVDDELRRGRDRAVAGAAAGGGAGAGTAGDAGPPRLPRMVREWRALLDALADQPEAAPAPYGYWGVSMGARYGIPLAAADPRIEAAVFGLFGLFPDPAFTAAVEAVTIPLLFLFQYDDELVTPESGLALWAAFGSTRKTMHINPGPHVGVPRFERDSSSAFYARHLG
jgi:dienelactone hydrolase